MTDLYKPRGTQRRAYNRKTAETQQAQVLEVAPIVAPREEAAEGEAVSPARRRKRANMGGYTLRLDAPERPGYVRRWVNDDGSGRPERLNVDLAYDFVHADDIKGDGLGRRISRVVGSKRNGEPMHAYLMETPEEEYAVGVAEKEDRLKPFEEAIRSGKDTTGELKEAETYRPGSGSSISVSRGR